MTKIDKQTKARELRIDGKSIGDIAAELSVAKSSVSYWVRDLPQPEKFSKEYRARKKLERLQALERVRQETGIGQKKERVLAGDKRWMIPIPPGYKGRVYKQTRYIYEHRYLMEQKLGRLLQPGEVVHHINGDRLDNRLENLELMTNEVHSGLHSRRQPKRRVFVIFNCAECGKEVSRNKVLVRPGNNFCSRSCAAKYQVRQHPILPPKRHIHGTDACYKYAKCRCEKCREEHAKVARELRRRKAGSTGK